MRLPPPNTTRPYTLRFTLMPGSKALRDGVLLSNYPSDGCVLVNEKCHHFDSRCADRKPFGRSRFLGHAFQYDGFHDAVCDLEIRQPGAFEYRVEFMHPTDGKRVQSPVGYFIVDPCLRLRRSDDVPDLPGSVLHMDSICIQTLVPKWMGPLKEWDAVLQEASESGYNMIHFVPMQQRGASNSPYSIYDQLSLSSDLFENQALSDKQKYAELDAVLANMSKTHGLMAISDVVWNHTAHNSAWLQVHPEAGTFLNGCCFADSS